MFTYVKIALLALKAASSIAAYLREQGLLDAGKDIAIGKAALEVLSKTDYGKQLTEKVDALGVDQLSDLERAIERHAAGER